MPLSLEGGFGLAGGNLSDALIFKHGFNHNNHLRRWTFGTNLLLVVMPEGTV